MYEPHFGLDGPPFQLNPDPAFFYESAGHLKALSYLRYGAQQGEGFIVVTGDVGAGKTTLVRALMQELDPQEIVAAQISNTQLDAADLLQSILTSFGVPTEGKSKARLIAMLEAFLTAVVASGRRALLIVDEAQNLSPAAVEELRLLSNFQLGHHGLMQCFLVGQPELREHLQMPAAEQLRQRILASYHLGPLDAAETAAYVLHRLKHVGWSGRPAFLPEALEAIHGRTGGIPRRINTLCNRLMLSAYLGDLETLSAATVHETADEMNFEMLPPRAAGAGWTEAAPRAGAEPAPLASAAPAVEPITVDRPAPSRDEVPRPAPALALAARVSPMPDAPAANHEAAEVSAAAESSRTAAVTRTPAGPTRLPPVPQGWDPGVTRVGIEAGEWPHRPLLCVADDPMSWYQLRSLGAAAAGDPRLPATVLVNPGPRSSLQRSWVHQVPCDAELAEVHLGVGPGPVGQTDAAVATRFAELVASCAPAAVLLAGASYPVLQCGLIARELGLPVVRLDAGAGRGDVESGRGTLCALLDRASHLLVATGEDRQRTLLAEGFAADALVAAGNCTARMLQDLQPHLPAFSTLMARLSPPRTWLTRAAVGFGLVSAQFDAGDVSPGDALQWLMLARSGSAELPLLWPVSDRSAAVMREPAVHVHLESAGIAVVREHDYLNLLSLLGRARCVVAGPARSLVDEATALGIPAIVVQLVADEPATPEDSLVTRVGPNAPQFKAAVRSALQRVATEPAAGAGLPDAHQEIVAHLAHWLAHQPVPATPSARVEAAA